MTRNDSGMASKLLYISYILFTSTIYGVDRLWGLGVGPVSGRCSLVLRSDFRCLVGRDFRADEDLYTVVDIASLQDYVLVEARRKAQEAGTVPIYRKFPVREVLDALVVDEEIVLFKPSLFPAL
jgi:hypothetical protein